VAKEIVVFDSSRPEYDSKIVKVDIGTLIQTGHGGEEKWLLKFYTPEFSDVDSRTGIKSVYLDQLSSGWYKSSGLVDNSYTISTNNDSLNIRLDNSSGTYNIVLDHGTGLKGKVVANEIKRKINDIPNSVDWVDEGDPIKFCYTNCNVKYKDDKFYILSGSSGEYSGAEVSSVRVSEVSGNTCYYTLGFHLGVSSEVLSDIIIKESLLLQNYVTNTSNLIIDNNISPEDGDVFYITDDLNEDYFVCVSGSVVGNLKIQTSAFNSYIGIKNNYLAGATKIQLLKKNDPDFIPTNYTTSIDDMIKWGINNIANKIDYRDDY